MIVSLQIPLVFSFPYFLCRFHIIMKQFSKALAELSSQSFIIISGMAESCY